MEIPVITGERLHIFLKGRRSDKRRIMTSQVLEDIKENVLTIATPMLGGRLIPIRDNRVINVLFYRSDGIYEFEAQVIGRSGGRIPSLKILALSPIQRNQRRDYFRLSTVRPVQVSIECNSGEEPSVLEYLTLDLSAGGMKLTGRRDIEKGCIIYCEIVLADRPLKVKAKVQRNIAVYNKEYDYEIGIQFIELDEKVRSWIIGYIFEEQRKLKRKGLI